MSGGFYFYSHAPCGARQRWVDYNVAAEAFLLTRPLRGATVIAISKILIPDISTHTPLAGRDKIDGDFLGMTDISTHTPLAGRDGAHSADYDQDNISTHTPLAGRDVLSN